MTEHEVETASFVLGKCLCVQMYYICALELEMCVSRVNSIY